MDFFFVGCQINMELKSSECFTQQLLSWHKSDAQQKQPDDIISSIKFKKFFTY